MTMHIFATGLNWWASGLNLGLFLYTRNPLNAACAVISLAIAIYLARRAYEPHAER